MSLSCGNYYIFVIVDPSPSGNKALHIIDMELNRIFLGIMVLMLVDNATAEVVLTFEPIPKSMVGNVRTDSSENTPFDLPMDDFTSFFPMMPMHNSGQTGFHNQPSNVRTDPFFGDTMSMMSHLTPILDQMAKQVDASVHPCSRDIDHYCTGSPPDRVLHCLGLHQQYISPTCKDEVAQSLPVVCNPEVELFWPHACQKSTDAAMTSADTPENFEFRAIMGCLVEKEDSLSSACRDTVVATKSLLDKLQNSKVTLSTVEDAAVTTTAPAVKGKVLASSHPNPKAHAAPKKRQGTQSVLALLSNYDSTVRHYLGRHGWGTFPILFLFAVIVSVVMANTTCGRPYYEVAKDKGLMLFSVGKEAAGSLASAASQRLGGSEQIPQLETRVPSVKSANAANNDLYGTFNCKTSL